MTVDAVAALSVPHQRRAFIVRFAGLGIEFWGGAGPKPGLTQIPGAPAGTYYTQVHAIAGDDAVSPESAKYWPEGGIAEQGTIQVKLAGSLGVASPYDPVVIFGRTGYRSAQNRAQLVTAIPQGSGGGVLTVDRDCSGWSYPRLVHVDAESVWATAATAVAPYTITYTSRGAAGTVPQPHGARDTDVPDVTDEVVNWRTRRAQVLVANVYDVASGARSDYIDVIRGFIDVMPEIDTTNGQVTITIAPLSGLLNVTLPNPNPPSRLAEGYHLFVHPYAALLEHVQYFPKGGAFRSAVGAASAAGSKSFTASDTQYNNCSDLTLTPNTHPRHLDIEVFNAGSDPMNVNTAVAGVFTTDNGPSVAVAQGDILTNAHAAEVHSTPTVDGPLGTETLAQWPQDVLTVINDSADADTWAPGVVTGASGAWADVRLQVAGDAADVVITSNCQDFPGPLKILLGVRTRPAIEALRDAGARVRFRVGSLVTLDLAGDPLYAGVDWRDPEDMSGQSGFREIDVSRTEGKSVRASFVGFARGFYQAGEPYILAADDLTIPLGGTVPVRVDWTDHFTGEERTQTLYVQSSTAKLDGATTVGYAWELTEDSRLRAASFGAWRGEDLPVLTPVLSFREERPRVLLLQLLFSSGGNQINHPIWDVLPFGVGLTEDEVDESSFLAIAEPPGASRWTQQIDEDTTASDIINDLLISIGYTIDVRRDAQGRARLTAIRVGLENEADKAGTITPSNIAIKPAPAWGSDNEVTNLLKIECNYRDGKPLVAVHYRDERSIRAHGEGNELALKLRGVTVPDPDVPGQAEAQFGALAARIFRMLADPRRTFQLRVSTGAAIRAELGMVYEITTPHLRGYDMSVVGVTSVLARVVAKRIHWWGEGADLTFLHYASNGAGWAWSGDVTAVGVNTFTIAANAYTDDSSDVADIDGVRVGAVLRFVPEADQDNYVVLPAVTAVDTATRVITCPGHTVATTAGWLEPHTYDAVLDTFMQSFMYLADGGQQLGAANDPGREVT